MKLRENYLAGVANLLHDLEHDEINHVAKITDLSSQQVKAIADGIRHSFAVVQFALGKRIAQAKELVKEKERENA